MLATKKYNQPKQKMIYSKDATLNFGNQGDSTNLFGFFKTSSSLAKSIRSTTGAASTAGKSLQSTGAMILNQAGPLTATNFFKPTTITPKSNKPFEEEKNKTYSNGWNLVGTKPESAKNQMDIKIRNITHDYTDIANNDYSYNVLSNLKSKKRMTNLDTLEYYEIWKKKHLKETEEKIKENIKILKEKLDSTKNEVYTKFLMQDNELIPLVQSDIDGISNFYFGVLKERTNSINECLKNIMDMLVLCDEEAQLKINKLEEDLDKIGYLLEEEIKEVSKEKKLYVQRFYDVKKNFYNRIMNEIKDSENELVQKSKNDLDAFILRWKNIKLNNYVAKIQKLLQSKEYSDPEERAVLITEIKGVQEDIYKKKYNLIFNQLFNLDYDQINTRNIEKMSKKFEGIVAEGDKLLTEYIDKLMKNSKDIQNKSLEAFEKFKEDVSTISSSLWR